MGRSEGGNLPDSPMHDRPEGTVPFVVLSLARETFAVEIAKVREIIRVPHITWVPGAPAVFRGVINLRGNVVAVVDLAAILSLPPAVENPDSRIMVVEADGTIVGMLVDSVSQVADIDLSQLEPSLRTLDVSQRVFVVAQSNLGDNLIGILDLDQVIRKAAAAPSAAHTEKVG